MRSIFISSLLLGAIACGGASKPAESASDNSKVDTTAPAASSSADEASSSTPPASSAAPAASAASTADQTPAAPTHPTPTATGAIDGRSFSPTIAHVTGKPKADGRILISLEEGTDCSGTPDAAVQMLITYKDGYKSDLGSLKRGSKKTANEIAFRRVGTDGKKEFSSTFKPTGTATVVTTAPDAMTPGKLKLDLTSGDYMLNGTVDIQACEAPATAANAKSDAAASPKKKKSAK
jgi:hypothetical protein